MARPWPATICTTIWCRTGAGALQVCMTIRTPGLTATAIIEARSVGGADRGDSENDLLVKHEPDERNFADRDHVTQLVRRAPSLSGTADETPQVTAAMASSRATRHETSAAMVVGTEGSHAW